MIDWMDGVFAFDLDDYLAVYQKIRAKATLQLDAVINEWNGLLLLHLKASLLELICQTCLVRRFKEARSQPAVNFDSCTNNERSDVSLSQHEPPPIIYADCASKCGAYSL